LLLAAQGFSRAGISKELGITQNTVRTHCHHVYRRLGVKTSVQAAIVGLREGWLSLDDGYTEAVSALHRAKAELTMVEKRRKQAEDDEKVTPGQKLYLQTFDSFLAAKTDEERDAAWEAMGYMHGAVKLESGLDRKRKRPRDPDPLHRLLNTMMRLK
jgi:hypothetical protein